MTDTVPDLLPCPFCGTVPNAPFDVSDKGDPEWWAICCHKCDVNTNIDRASLEQAVEAWNTRAIPDGYVETQALIEWLKTQPNQRNIPVSNYSEGGVYISLQDVISHLEGDSA